jgi:hypothetical protein
LAEAKLQNDAGKPFCHSRGPFPEIGKVTKIELYDYRAEKWFRWYF